MSAGPLAAVMAPMAEEVAPLLRRLEGRRQRDGAPDRTFVGRLGGRRMLVGICGDGPRRAAAGIESLLAGAPVRGLVILGVAGALTPDLAPGALLVAREVVSGSRVVPAPDPDWTAMAVARGAAVVGTLVSAERIVSSPRERAALAVSLGLREPAAVDLESAACAAVAGRHGVPYLVVRAISDAADETLPLDFERCRDRAGSIDRGRVLLQLLARPWRLGRLLRLRRRVRQCAEHLATFVEELAWP